MIQIMHGEVSCDTADATPEANMLQVKRDTIATKVARLVISFVLAVAAQCTGGCSTAVLSGASNLL